MVNGSSPINCLSNLTSLHLPLLVVFDNQHLWKKVNPQKFLKVILSSISCFHLLKLGSKKMLMSSKYLSVSSWSHIVCFCRRQIWYNNKRNYQSIQITTNSFGFEILFKNLILIRKISTLWSHYTYMRFIYIEVK